MKSQNYLNHIQYYTPHHFVFYPIISLLSGISICAIFKSQENTILWIVLSSKLILICWLSFMLRQHYSIMNQNRIARLELRFRYYILTQKRFEEIEQQLSLSQVLALRFASDDELVSLISRSLKEHLSAKEIKKAIKNWLPDYMRV